MRFITSFLAIAASALISTTSIAAQTTGVTHCRNGNIALTFDDDASIFTRETIDRLVEAGQHATFFINVNNFVCGYEQQHIDLWRYAVSKKMTLGSHTAGHPHLPQLSVEKIRFEIQAVNDYLNKTVGVVPKYFRFPFGESDTTTEDIVRHEFGMKVVSWSLDTGDSLGKTLNEQFASLQGLNADSQDIVLMHDTNPQSAREEVPRALKFFADNNIKSSGIAKCLGHQFYSDAYSYYQPHNNPREPDWNCNNIPIGNY